MWWWAGGPLVTAFLGGMSATSAESWKPVQNQDNEMPAISPSGCIPPPNILNTLTKLLIYQWVLLQVARPSPFPARLGAHRARPQQQPRCPSSPGAGYRRAAGASRTCSVASCGAGQACTGTGVRGGSTGHAGLAGCCRVLLPFSQLLLQDSG